MSDEEKYRKLMDACYESESNGDLLGAAASAKYAEDHASDAASEYEKYSTGWSVWEGKAIAAAYRRAKLEMLWEETTDDS